MDGQNVLRRDGHHQHQTDHQPFDPATLVVALPVDHGQCPVGQRMRQAGFGDGHGKGTQQRIGQCHGSPPAEPTIESFKCALHTQAADQPTCQGTDDQGDDHVHAGQAQYQHDADRGNHCIHGGLTSLGTKKRAL